MSGSVNVGRENGSSAADCAARADNWLAPQPAALKSAAAVAGYTFAHAGRQIRLGPVAFWIFVGTVVIMAGWSIATATYFAFRDDVLKGLIARQAEQQYAYEDRIAELRARIDRTTSRQLLDQEQFEQKLDDLMRRQSTLESRATALGAIADPVVTGSNQAGAECSARRFADGSPQARDRRSATRSPTARPGARRAGKDADINARLARRRGLARPARSSAGAGARAAARAL